METLPNNARSLAAFFAAASAIPAFALLPFSKIDFAYADLPDASILIVLFLALSLYCRTRRFLRVAMPLEALAVAVSMTVPILISTYLAASLSFPLQDAQLVKADAALSFDWMAFIKYVDSHPALSEMLGFAYRSFGWQLFALPMLLGLAGRAERSYVMVISYGLICYVSTVISIWFPALGTYTIYNVTQDQVPNIAAYYGFAFLDDFHAVREQSVFALSVMDASGIITFPSVHAGAAFLCAWATWDLKYFRYPVLAWNVLMGLSAISHANHYMIDVLAGAGIAALSIFFVTRTLLLMQRSRWPFLRSPQAPTLAFGDQRGS